MFSQLCRAKPRALWNKTGIGQTVINVTDTQRKNLDIEFNGEDRCQLEHCKFCDFRLCCQVTQSWETECIQGTESDSLATDNPAYGLSSKNWLEAKEIENDGGEEDMNMESLVSPEQDANCDNPGEGLTANIPFSIPASQQDKDRGGANTLPKMNPVNFQSHVQQNKMDSKIKHAEETSEIPTHDIHSNDAKHGKLTWSMLRHRQLSGDILKNCDNKSSNVIEHSTNERNHHVDIQDRNFDSSLPFKTKKDRSFPLSLVRPITKISDKKPENFTQHFNHVFKNDLLRQRPVQRNAREKYLNPGGNKGADTSKQSTNDILGLNSNPLSDIAQIKTEESIQEWLARIGESPNNPWSEESEEKGSKQRLPWNSIKNTDEEKSRDNLKHRAHNFGRGTDDIMLSKRSQPLSQSIKRNSYDDLSIKSEELDTSNVLCNASKISPANVPMVVMQCSRLHSRVGSKPPFQQTSLPMGTLVTALYQESDWLYVQTPHGIEGFVLSSNCVPIGTINEPAQTSRRPWEPCDFPIQITLQKKHEFGRQPGSYIPAKLPTNSGKQAPPYVSTVKMKTNFYSDRYFSHTFKSKDSIKTAKTVTDILRSSPETKISNQ